MSEEQNDQLNLDAHSENLVEEEKIEAALSKHEGDLRQVNMGCRRNEHVDGRPGASSGDGDVGKSATTCASKRAYVMTDVIDNVQMGHSIYRCVDCGYSWSVSTGGTFKY